MNEMFSQGGKGSTGILTNKQAVARHFGVKQSEVVYFSVGALLDGYKVIYDKITQRAYSLPANLGSGVTTVSLSTTGVLVHSAGSVDLGELAVAREEYVTLPGSFDTGATLNVKNEILTHTTGKYRWDGELPKTVLSGSTPASTGGEGIGAWVSVGDGVLRSQLTDPDGVEKFPDIQMSRWRDEGDVRGWGVKVDGETDDSDALIAAINSGRSKLRIPAGRCILSKTIAVPSGVTLEGSGIDYWDTYRPAPDRLLKSWSKGTHLVFTGTGVKDKTFGNISNERPLKSVNGVDCKFTSFTNEDAVGTTPATLKSFSVAVMATHTSQLKNLRIMLSNNGIDGYNDFSSSSLGDNWDIGLHVYDSSEAVIENVQVCGYWRVAGTLLTENDGSLTMKGNPERTRFNRFYTQGIRGLLIRNSPQIDVVSNTSSTITFKQRPSLRLTATNSFRISGSAALYTFTGSTSDGTNITLTGITPSLPASLGVIRFPNIGNNFSGTVFENTVATSFEHSSGQSSDSLGLPVAFALEIDGYPMRNLRFDKFKAQTTFDKGNTLFGDCRDTKIVSSEFENGIMVAYSLAETQGYTGNLRLFASDIQASTDTTGFTPRDAFLDNRQIKTDFTDGSFILKNWRETNTRVQFSNGNDAIVLREGASEASPGGYYFYTKDGLRWITMDGVTKGLDFSASNGSIKFNGDNSPVMTWFGASGNVSVKGIIAPMVDNSKSNGSASLRWAQIYAVNGTINTSDIREKQQQRLLYDAEKKAAAEIKLSIRAYKRNDEVERDGDGAKWHFGVMAQEVAEILNRNGLDHKLYHFLSYEEWDDVPEVIDEKTGKILSAAKPAGNRWGIEYSQLLCFIISAM